MPKILFVTLPELGQANVHLAVMREILQRTEDLDLHLASFGPLKASCPEGVTFHSVVGSGVGERLGKPALAAMQTNPDSVYRYCTRPGLIGTFRAVVQVIDRAFHPETPSECLETIRAIEGVIEDVQPDLIAVDPLFDQAYDAASASNRPTIILSPNTLQETALPAQELNAFKWPATNTGWTYPVPLWLRPFNIFLMIFMALWVNKLSPSLTRLIRARNEAGYPGPLPVLQQRTNELYNMSLPELEYGPCIIPPNQHPCGPILLPSRPLKEVDPELYAWLKRRKTVMLALGSHVPSNIHSARNLYHGFAALLEQRPDVQILWKWRGRKEGVVPSAELEKWGDRLRIVEWMKADPVSVLREGCVGVINHGGSNSYHEALTTGTPQVVMSVWFDTHDIASKAEWLGVGIWGNRHHAPRDDGEEFKSALLRLVGNTPDSPGALRYAARCKEVAAIINAAHGGRSGRELVADAILARIKEEQGQ